MRHVIVEQALALLAGEAARTDVLSSPQVVRDYLSLRLADREHEVFTVVFLDVHLRVIETVELFRGTLAQTSVYPREVVIEALRRNAAAVILAHNHPSGCPEPSRSDELLTSTLRAALMLIDVKVVDHVVVARTGCVSFAERGLL